MTDAKRVQVRRGFTEENVWREALGGAEPLLCFVTYGPLDAPDNMPAGSHRSIPAKYGSSQPTSCDRPRSYS